MLPVVILQISKLMNLFHFITTQLQEIHLTVPEEL
jgi:hypothetical protein